MSRSPQHDIMDESANKSEAQSREHHDVISHIASIDNLDRRDESLGLVNAEHCEDNSKRLANEPEMSAKKEQAPKLLEISTIDGRPFQIYDDSETTYQSFVAALESDTQRSKAEGSSWSEDCQEGHDGETDTTDLSTSKKEEAAPKLLEVQIIDGRPWKIYDDSEATFQSFVAALNVDTQRSKDEGSSWIKDCQEGLDGDEADTTDVSLAKKETALGDSHYRWSTVQDIRRLETSLQSYLDSFNSGEDDSVAHILAPTDGDETQESSSPHEVSIVTDDEGDDTHE